MSSTPLTLILGATSGLGKAVAHRLAGRGEGVILAGRDRDRLQEMADDLRIRYRSPVHTAIYDAVDYPSHEAFFNGCAAHPGQPLSAVVLCQGAMSDQAAAERDFGLCREMIDVNYTSAVSLLNLAAAHFSAAGGGTICAVSSVAGDRGRQSNYIYGSTKAALSTYLAGLRNRMAGRGVAVITVKPGFMDTAMTFGLVKPGSPLLASPERVARDVVRAIDRRKDQIYTPWFWRWIMAIITRIPEPIFKRMKL